MYSVAGAAARGLARVGTSLAAGVAVDRAASALREARTIPAPDPTGNHQPLWGTGDQRLHQMAAGIAEPAAAHPVVAGIAGQIESRAELVSKGAEVVRHPREALQQAQAGFRQCKDEVAVTHGAFKLATGQAAFTAEDGRRVVKAGAAEAVDDAMDRLRNLDMGGAARALYTTARKARDASYALATTSDQGMQELAHAVHARARFEMETAAVGLGASQVAARAIGMIPHPAAKLASAVIGATGPMAAGARLSEGMHRLGGDEAAAAGAAHQELARILKEKSRRDRPAEPPAQAAAAASG